MNIHEGKCLYFQVLSIFKKLHKTAVFVFNEDTAGLAGKFTTLFMLGNFSCFSCHLLIFRLAFGSW